MELARRTLGSLARGVEIGASAFNAFPGVEAWNFDHPGGELFQKAQLEIAGQVARVDVHATADVLPIASGALDFLLASHVIEHMPDTIRALGEWDRVLRVGGIAFLIVPHRERTFDRVRPRTDLRHHLADFALGTTAGNDPLVPTSHYHVWITECASPDASAPPTLARPKSSTWGSPRSSTRMFDGFRSRWMTPFWWA